MPFIAMDVRDTKMSKKNTFYLWRQYLVSSRDKATKKNKVRERDKEKPVSGLVGMRRCHLRWYYLPGRVQLLHKK